MHRQTFGAPSSLWHLVAQLTPATPLFLYHTQKKAMFGVFEATSMGTQRLSPFAFSPWSTRQERDMPGRRPPSPYPSQVLFGLKYRFLPLPEANFSKLLQKRDRKFVPTLTARQVSKLIDKFSEHDADTARRAAAQLQKFFHLSG